MQVLTRTLHWLLNAEDGIQRSTGGMVRILDDKDTAALYRLSAQDPVSNCYVLSLLASGRGAGPVRDISRGVFLGIDSLSQPEELVAACWVGSNVIPIEADLSSGEVFGSALLSLRRRFGSIFGPASAVRGIWSTLRFGPQQARSLRPHQPLLTTSEPSSISPNPDVRPAQKEDLDLVIPASAEMFTEELGFSPLRQGVASYRNRIDQLINRGHCMVEIDDAEWAHVVFKADFGVVTQQCVQLQGVWIDPRYRGEHRAAPALASVVNHALGLAPVVSLYVNDYNTFALMAYRRVGFRPYGEFATVLF